MRKLAPLLVGSLVVMSAAGCANLRDRRWGMCALAGDSQEEVPPPPLAKGTKLGTVGEAYFDFDKADLETADGARDVLAEVLRVMRDNPTLHVMVEGHTDSVGSDAYNQKLSERRAGAVKAYLVRQGIDAGRLDTRGYGETRPVATNSAAAGRAQNRRAELIVE